MIATQAVRRQERHRGPESRSTQEAITGAQRLEQILAGSLTGELRQLQQLGDAVQPRRVGRPAGAAVRSGWPDESRALQSAITTLDTLSKQMQTVVQNILHAGGGG